MNNKHQSDEWWRGAEPTAHEQKSKVERSSPELGVQPGQKQDRDKGRGESQIWMGCSRNRDAQCRQQVCIISNKRCRLTSCLVAKIREAKRKKGRAETYSSTICHNTQDKGANEHGREEHGGCSRYGRLSGDRAGQRIGQCNTAADIQKLTDAMDGERAARCSTLLTGRVPLFGFEKGKYQRDHCENVSAHA